ncbi:MAG: long-chain fatty acid--CoA ligase [Acidobacteriota bacterium]
MPTPQPPLGPAEPADSVHRDARNLGDLIRLRSEATPEQPFAFVRGSTRRDGQSRWRPRSWQRLYDEARQVTQGLVELGLRKGDSIAVLGTTGYRWAVYELGIQILGGISVGVYPHQSAEQLRYLLDHSESRLIFVEGEDELATVLQALRPAPQAVEEQQEEGDQDIQAASTTRNDSSSSEVRGGESGDETGDGGADLETLAYVVPWSEELAARHSDSESRIRSPRRFRERALPPEQIEELLAAVRGEDIAMLIYTSGTTGRPKGAQISHGNVLHLCGSLTQAFPYLKSDCYFSFLPMAHATERNLSFYGRIATGIPTGHATHLSNLLAELPEVGPTIFGSVPRGFEKIYARLQARRERSGWLQRSLFDLALAVGWRRAEYRIAGEPVPWRWRFAYYFAYRLVLHRIHAAFGGRIRVLLIGAAPTPLPILRFFWSAGLDMLEAYGLTEATVLSHINSPRVRLGTVGLAAPDMECRLAQDGEILLRGPAIFQGYHRDPEATAETIRDGWLYTGDIGSIDEDGFLTITDRKKHILITAGGKNIAPASVSAQLEPESPLISHVHVHGEGRPYVSAVLVPNVPELLDWGMSRNLIPATQAEAWLSALGSDPALRDRALAAEIDPWIAKLSAEPACRYLLLEAVRRGNQHLARVERVRRFTVLGRGLDPSRGELTATMKPRRAVLERHFAPLLDRLYEDSSFGLEAEAPG